ncbi:MAG: hypothetical protein HYT31_00840 [Parcubacteria group bacterium]|nr:hypothetical protein [Parcubacteria group bacterium]
MLGVVTYALSFPVAAQAYLDAGTGSYLVQLAVAFVAGGLFMVKIFWHRVVAFFIGGSKNKVTREDKER